MEARTNLTEAEALFIQRQRVARLATADTEGRPYVVPVCYAFDGAHFYSPLDEKPKRVAAAQLKRVRNIESRPEVSLVIDRYDDDWSQLAYLQVAARAELLEPGDEGHATALALLRERYPQYRSMALEQNQIIAMTPTSLVSWRVEAKDSAQQRNSWLEPGRGVDFLPVARGRQSVRAFKDRPVPRAALEEMIEAARWAPSPHGAQPWRFVVLTRLEAKRTLAEAMGDEWRRTLAMDGETEEVVARRLQLSRQRIEQAPALILACLYLADLDLYPDLDRQRAEEVMAIQSLGAAIQNMLLAAYSLGLDTGWMCAPLFAQQTVRAALELDASLIPHALIPVGYRAAEPRRRPHRPANELMVRFD
jgi:coenzyme F420-0:L-glutamate ligase / coenzyme F420-1:gamma-L-glutamate ligase